MITRESLINRLPLDSPQPVSDWTGTAFWSRYALGEEIAVVHPENPSMADWSTISAIQFGHAGDVHYVLPDGRRYPPEKISRLVKVKHNGS